MDHTNEISDAAVVHCAECGGRNDDSRTMARCPFCLAWLCDLCALDKAHFTLDKLAGKEEFAWTPRSRYAWRWMT